MTQPRFSTGIRDRNSPRFSTGIHSKRIIASNADFDVVRPGGESPDFKWMIEHGTIVSARFVKNGVDGGFFEYQDHSVFVHVLDSSWRLDDNPMLQMKVDATVPVRIIGYDYRENRYVGSLNGIEYENPFRELSRFDPNTVFRGKIAKHVKYDDPTQMQGYIVMLPNQSYGFLNPPSVYRKDIRIGQEIDVIIANISYSERGLGKVFFDTLDCNTRKNFKPEKHVTSDADFDEVRPPRYKLIID